MFAYVMYSHSTYGDCWGAHFSRLNKHCPFEFTTYNILTEAYHRDLANVSTANGQVMVRAYNDEDCYSKRLLNSVKLIDEDFILFCHEDMILYDDLNEPNFIECINTIVEEWDIDFIKLLKSGCDGDPHKGSSILKEIDSSSKYIFSIQPSLWKRNKLIEFLEENPGRSGCELEEYCQDHFRRKSTKQLFAHNIAYEKRRGQMHCDSQTWPAMSTAIRKGKWMMSEYSNELNLLFEEYNIDSSLRGTI